DARDPGAGGLSVGDLAPRQGKDQEGQGERHESAFHSALLEMVTVEMSTLRQRGRCVNDLLEHVRTCPLFRRTPATVSCRSDQARRGGIRYGIPGLARRPPVD